jgi:hypothetical protein
VSLEMLFNRRTLHQNKRQHDRFTTLDGVKVLCHGFGEAFHCRTMEAAPSMEDQHGNKIVCRMTYRSPYLVKTNERFSNRNSPKETYRGRSEYMLDRFSSKSTATRWLLTTRMPCPKALRYINSPQRSVSKFGRQRRSRVSP